MSIVLYYTPMSSADRVRWALEELGLPYEKVKVDLRSGEQKKPEYLKLNPNGKVPTLVIDGVPMFESMAILIYLGEKYGVDKGLWPKHDSADYQRALVWGMWSVVTLGGNISRYYQNSGERFSAEIKHAPAAAAAQQDIEKDITILDAHLAKQPYLAGQAFTLADIPAVNLLHFAMSMMKITLPESVKQWMDRCGQRKAVAAIMAG